MIEKAIENFAKTFLEKINSQKRLCIVSHFDTDGITSAAILSKALKKLNKQFSVKILKQLDKEEIQKLSNQEMLIFLDLGSNNLNEIKNLSKSSVIIIDHHELNKTDAENLTILNPHLLKNYEDLCTAELTYLVSKQISRENQELAYLSIIGMIGDTMEKNITPLRNSIINDADVKIKKGLLIYPSTRPIDRALEYSSRPFIPGVTGNSRGVQELLKEAGISKTEKNFKALIDLTEPEMTNLVTSILLRNSAIEKSEYLGNLYLIKLFNKLEDARELSATINACSRMDYPEIALLFCMGNLNARKKADRIYLKYRQSIISGLRYIENNEKIKGKEFVIINAKDNIKDTIIGTLASILSFSPIYQEGTIIIAMAYNENKIKISTRIAGKNSPNKRNLKEFLHPIISNLGGETGGHKNAAGGTIDKEHEEKFIQKIQKELEYEVIKI